MELFLLGLLIVSVLTGLATEAVKALCDEHGKSYHPNTLSGIVSVVISVLVGIGYVLYTESAVTGQTVGGIIALALMSWICAMVGYDKVKQAVTQFKDTLSGSAG
ncbi:MAG: aminopeptidase [Clostridiales bacterium]|nr:aminopeptidase [Clostridiales bacterium]